MKDQILKIIESKKKYDSYRYYCDLCLEKGRKRKTTHAPSYQGKVIDVCDEHYIEVCRKKGQEPIMDRKTVEKWEKKEPRLIKLRKKKTS